MMLVFIAMASFLASKKQLSKNDIGISETDFESLNYQKELMGFLNFPLSVNDKGEKIRDLIISGKSDEVETEFKKFFLGLEPKPECYILRNAETNFEVSELSGLGGRSNSRAFVDSFLSERGSEIYFFNDEKKVNLKFYIGKC